MASTKPTIGYIGCSNTWMSAGMYAQEPGNLHRLWPTYDISGGTINSWADPSSTFWGSYMSMVKKYGQPPTVWFELCEAAGAFEGDPAMPASYDMVKAALANLKAISPNAQVYISPINTYDPNPGLCALMGTNGQGVTDTQTWAAQAVTDGLALAGPQLGPLTAATTQSDGCHPSSAAQPLIGGQMVDFFDHL